jgi:L-aminopeptidase/D-esterase-like protein
VGLATQGASGGALTDVPGIRVGHWTDREAGTGCTVVLCEQGATAGVDVRGAAPGTRETDLLRPGSLVEHVHAVLLGGGSAFGLDAAAGVMRYLEERGIGFPTPTGPVPIVPAAVLFDLGVGRADVRPDAAAGYAACVAASTTVAEGSLGAGTGATVAKAAGLAGAVKGGVGTASRVLPGGAVVAALVAVNAVGSVHDPASGAVLASPRRAGGSGPLGLAGASTTLAVVATTAPLGKAAANRLASVAHDGLALAIRPAHTVYDGDTVFALSLPRPGAPPPVEPVVLAAAAGEVVAAAIVRAVRLATGLHGVPAAGEQPGPVPARAER